MTPGTRIIDHLPTLLRGVRHIEQLVDPLAFLTELAADGFELHLDHGATTSHPRSSAG